MKIKRSKQVNQDGSTGKLEIVNQNPAVTTALVAVGSTAVVGPVNPANPSKTGLTSSHRNPNLAGSSTSSVPTTGSADKHSNPGKSSSSANTGSKPEKSVKIGSSSGLTGKSRGVNNGGGGGSKVSTTNSDVSKQKHEKHNSKQTAATNGKATTSTSTELGPSAKRQKVRKKFLIPKFQYF